MLRQAVAGSQVMSDVVRSLGLLPRGSNYRTVCKHIERLGLSTSHLLKPGDPRFAEQFPHPDAYTPESIRPLYREGTTLSKVMKKSLRWFKDATRCSECGQGRKWHGKPLVLQIDHVNGDSTDNRFENLRYLCPNCHSQTSTFAGRKNKVVRALKPRQHFTPADKIVWPENDVLAEMVRTTPTSALAIQLGVSDSAIGKRCRKLGIQKPGRGSWAKTAS
jgi:Zn finger protein HypA/HybF involved in hydrogenase expression